MMREYENLAEWLELKGNPKYCISSCKHGKVIAIADDEAIAPCLVLFVTRETDTALFVEDNGLRLRKEYLPAIIGLLDTSTPEYTLQKFNVVIWDVDEEEDIECEAVIDIIEAASEYHAKAMLIAGLSNKKYPQGAWIDYVLDGKRISFDIHGRIPA